MEKVTKTQERVLAVLTADANASIELLKLQEDSNIKTEAAFRKALEDLVERKWVTIKKGAAALTKKYINAKQASEAPVEDAKVEKVEVEKKPTEVRLEEAKQMKGKVVEFKTVGGVEAIGIVTGVGVDKRVDRVYYAVKFITPEGTTKLAHPTHGSATLVEVEAKKAEEFKASLEMITGSKRAKTPKTVEEQIIETEAKIKALQVKLKNLKATVKTED